MGRSSRPVPLRLLLSVRMRILQQELWKNLRGGHDGSIAMQNRERGDTRKDNADVVRKTAAEREVVTECKMKPTALLIRLLEKSDMCPASCPRNGTK